MCKTVYIFVFFRFDKSNNFWSRFRRKKYTIDLTFLVEASLLNCKLKDNDFVLETTVFAEVILSRNNSFEIKCEMNFSGY